MRFDPDDRERALADAGAALGKACVGLTPAQAGEDWRKAGARELLREAGVAGAGIFLDAYAAARGSLKAARVHAEEAMGLAPRTLEAVLLAGGVAGLLQEAVENLGLDSKLKPAGFPSVKEPDVRRALADARTGALIARNLAQRAAWLASRGSAEHAGCEARALAVAADAVLKVWPPLSRLVVGEERYARAEADLFRVAVRMRPAAVAAVATELVGAPGPKGDRSMTATVEARPVRES
jgi:hypothetical protein